MDWLLFLQSLTYQEKCHLLQLIQADLSTPENETLDHFLMRHERDDKLSTRLRSVYGYAKEHGKSDLEQSPLNKPARGVTYDDVYIWKGMGKKTWEEFVKLRGY